MAANKVNFLWSALCEIWNFPKISKERLVHRLLLLLFLFTAIELSLGGSSPYTSRDNTNKNNYI